MKILTLIFGACLLTGCISTVYEAPDGTVMRRLSFGTLTDFESLEARSGDRELKVRGYTSDQIKAFEAIAEGVAKGLSAAAP